MATDRAGTTTPASRHADRTDRHRATHHHTHPRPARDPRRTQRRPAAARHRAHPGLTHPSDAPARVDTRVRIVTNPETPGPTRAMAAQRPSACPPTAEVGWLRATA